MRRIWVDFEGGTWEGELWDDRAPRTVATLWSMLPLEAPVTNTYYGGEILRLWIHIDPPPGGLENASGIHNYGDILFMPEVTDVPHMNGLRFVYGAGQMGGAAGGVSIPKIGRLLGDLAGFKACAKRVEWEGEKPLRIRRGE